MSSNGKIFLSVLTVSYNEAKSIRKTIESVLNQSEKCFEYVVKDGGSKDNTNKIVESYRTQFKNKGIQFIHIIENDNGIYDAMNKGVEKCEGKYILFLNAGDAFNNGEVVAELKRNNCNADVCYGDALMCDNGSFLLFRADMGLIKKRMPFSHQSCFLKREILLEEKFDLHYKICGDYDLILRLYEKGCTFKDIDTIICDYYLNGVSSTQFVEKRKEHEKILFSHGLNTKKSCFAHMVEAYVKQIAIKLVPLYCLNKLKDWYKLKIKHYESIL